MSLFQKVAFAATLIGPIAFATPSLALPPSCTNGVNKDALAALGAQGCQIGDKIYSNFAFSSNFSTSGTFNFTNAPSDQHTLSAAGLALMAGNTYTYSYTVAIAPGNPFTTFKAFRTGSGTSDVNAALVGTKTLTSSPGGTVIANNDSTSPVFTFGPTVAVPLNFSSTINITSGRLDIFSDSIVQQELTPQASPSPAPLPILGAAAAFGSVRKLRRFSSALKQV